MSRPPVKYTIDELCEQCYKFASRGLKIPHMAAQLGVSERWLYKKKSQSAKLRQRIEEGKNYSIGVVVNQLFLDAKEPGNLSAKQYYLWTMDPENFPNPKARALANLQPKQAKNNNAGASDYSREDYEAAEKMLDERYQ